MSERAEASGGAFWGDANDTEARERYQTLVNTIDDGIYQLNAEARFVAVNDSIVELTGYGREELLGEHVSLLFDDGDSSTIEREIERLRSNPAEQSGLHNLAVQTVEGEQVRCEVRVSLLEADDTMGGTVGTVRDITEQKYREQELREIREQLEGATEGTSVGIWTWDIQENVVTTDEYLAEAYGMDSEKAVRAPMEAFYEPIHEDDEDEVWERLNQAVEGTGELEAEYRVRDADGERMWVEARGEVEYDDDGEPIRMHGVISDITERKERERKLEESNERLEQFAYAASHDLQEPLRMVSSYLQMIERRYADELDEDGEEFIEFAVDGADRMRDMIEGLLEYSRVGTRGDPFEPVDLNDVLADVRADLQVRINESDAAIAAESLPQVDGDAGQLRQVFQNLLDNAIAYSGDEPPRIQISAERDGDHWLISVSDEGVGIDPDDADRIFEVFQSLQTQAEQSGTGIGLALCERIVERHDGDIWVDSEPGEGSTFTFTLPAGGDYNE